MTNSVLWNYVFTFVLFCSLNFAHGFRATATHTTTTNMKGCPKLPCEGGLQKLGETCLICYDRQHKVPLWCQQLIKPTSPSKDMTRDEIVKELLEKKRSDPYEWSNDSPGSLIGSIKYPDNGGMFEPVDGQNFDRGHLCAREDFPKSERDSSFHVINRVPQESSFNRGSWNQIEKQTREFINATPYNDYCTVTSVSGFTGAKIRERGGNGVEVSIPHTWTKEIYKDGKKVKHWMESLQKPTHQTQPNHDFSKKSSEETKTTRKTSNASTKPSQHHENQLITKPKNTQQLPNQPKPNRGTQIKPKSINPGIPQQGQSHQVSSKPKSQPHVEHRENQPKPKRHSTAPHR